MASESQGVPQTFSESSMTVPSDSENYDANNESSPSPPSSSSSPLILYSPPTIWGLLRGAAINLVLPFINGLMLGFGELLAHEAAYRLGWSGTKASRQHLRFWRARPLIRVFQIFPDHRHSMGPGVEIRDDPIERRRREEELEVLTSME